METRAITTHDLTVYYGRHRGIVGLNMEVRQGEIYGFLGPNGAGKTTTLRVLMDVIRPTSGSARVFGLDSQKDGPAIRAQVGYLPGELSLFPDMRGRDFLALMGSLAKERPNPSYQQHLVERLDLNPLRTIREYSRGNKQKVGLVAAFQHRPALLVLDEPTSGLDPLVQQVVLELAREARAEGRTVLFSSHNLPEVQAVADRVGIIRDGRLVTVETVETLTRRQFRRLTLVLAKTPPPEAFAIPGVALVTQVDRVLTLEVRDNLNEALRVAAQYGILDLETPPVTLEDAFLAYFGEEGGNNGRAASA